MSKEFIPRTYQKLAIDFILDTRRAALFADMGMGKTASALTAHDTMLLCGYETRPALVVAPLRVARKTWSDEIKKWDHLSGMTVSTIVGDQEQRRIAAKRDVQVHIINFDNLPWLIQTHGDRWPYGSIIIDESTRLGGLRVSVRVKNGKRWVQGQGTIRARKLAKLAFYSRNERWLNLTGTPAPNGLKKLYGQIWFQDFGERLGNSFSAFEKRWFTLDRDGYKLVPLPNADREIHAKIKDVCLSLLAKDYFDLKEPIEIKIEVELPVKARKLYREMKNKFYIKIGEREVEALNAGSKALKLLQLASGAIYLDPETENDDDPRAKDWVEVHDEKIQALESVISECNGMPLIVAYQFRSDIERLKKAFPKGRDFCTEKDEDDFKAGKIDLLFIHPASGGHGIDGFQYITNRIAFFSQWPDMELRDQLIGRIGPVRQFQAGFDRPVYVYDIVAVDTRDEDVLESHVEKREIQDFLLDAMRR
jgi:SNF2 family DNA or RNA helicase